MTCTDKAAEIRADDVFEIAWRVIAAADEEENYVCEAVDKTARRVFHKSTLLAGRRVARPLRIGDRVTLKPDRHRVAGWFGEIVAIRNSVYFVDWEAVIGTALPSARWFSSDLERAPAPDTKVGTCHS